MTDRSRPGTNIGTNYGNVASGKGSSQSSTINFGAPPAAESPPAPAPDAPAPEPGGPTTYRAVLVVDARGFSGTTSAQQADTSAEIVEVLEAAFRRAGLAAEWQERQFRPRAHTGDGYIVGLRPEVLPRLLHPFLRELQDELRERDRRRPRSQAQLRLRASIHVGPLPAEGVGQPMTDTHRLLDSDELRQALARSHQDVTFLAAIISKRVFEDWVRGGHTGLHPAHFTSVAVEVKTFREEAYLYVPEPSLA